MTIQQTYYFYLVIILSVVLSTYFAYRKGIILKIRYAGIWNCKVHLNTVFFLIIALAISSIPLINRECGTDTFWYRHKYAEDTMVGVDPLFYTFTKVLHLFTEDPKVAYGVVAFITLVIVFIAFSRIRELVNVPMCMAAYFFTLYYYNYNYVRIMFAASIVLLSYSYLLTEDNRKAFICMAISVGFHFSSIVVLLSYAGIELFKHNRQLLYMIVGALGLMFILEPRFFLSLITYERYREMIDFRNIETVHIGFGKLFIMIPIIIVILSFYNRFYQDRIYKIMVMSMLINLEFALLGYYVAVASRLSNMYFVMQTIYFIPWLQNNMKHFTEKVFVFTMFFVHIVLVYYLLTNNFVVMGIMPYK